MVERQKQHKSVPQVLSSIYNSMMNYITHNLNILLQHVYETYVKYSFA